MDKSFVLNVVSALFILVIIFFHSFTMHKEKKTEVTFMFLLIFVLIFDFLAAMASISNEYWSSTTSIAYSFKTISAIAFSIIVAIFAKYTYEAINQCVALSKLHKFVWIIPIIWNFCCIIINDFTHRMFKYSSSGIEYGKLYPLLITPLILIMIYMPIMAFKFKRNLYWPNFRILAFFPVFSLGYGVFQLMMNYVHDEFISYSTVFFSLIATNAYLYMQKDSMNIDPVSKLYMRNQCLDDLKHSNDSTLFLFNVIGFHTYSNSLGDELLVYISDYLSKILEKNYTLYRISSNQFVAIARDLDDMAILSRIHVDFQKYLDFNGEKLNIKIKCAMMRKKKEFTPEHTLYILESMIKEINYNDSYIIYNQALAFKLEESEKNTKKIITAVNDEEAVPYFQGIYSLEDNKLVLCEALARLKVGNELMNPAQFLPILSENKYIEKLDRNILIKVLKELNKLDVDSKDKIKGISINFTADDILNDSFINEVKMLIIENQIDPKMVCFELCESVVIENFFKVKEVMEDLKNFGIRFFLDDFGTGFSNIKAVLNLPFYLIKIDKSLLDAAKINEKNKLILNGIVSSLNSIGVKTLVEGAETKEDVELVKSTGANYIQGYYFHKPSKFEQLVNKIDKQ